MFVPKVRLFPLFYWFMNFTLTDKHGAKNLYGPICTWAPIANVLMLAETEENQNSLLIGRFYTTDELSM